mmetsp:Transcript_7773/g.15905  ORF Transcript_7773/g.15905 Transcript_7773/m.15905 type:complete len:100 (+) Transcript_7773:214-513(+)
MQITTFSPFTGVDNGFHCYAAFGSDDRLRYYSYLDQSHHLNYSGTFGNNIGNTDILGVWSPNRILQTHGWPTHSRSSLLYVIVSDNSARCSHGASNRAS